MEKTLHQYILRTGLTMKPYQIVSAKLMFSWEYSAILRKASRVIPNKVYQSLACGRPVITRFSDAYEELADKQRGLLFVPPASSESLAEKISELIADRPALQQHAQKAHDIYLQRYSLSILKKDLKQALTPILDKCL